MAGICGFISKQPISIQNLVAMHQKIAHRGRDDRGILGIMDDYDCKRIEINKDDDSSDMSSQHEEKYVAGLGFHRNIPGNAWSKSPIHYEIEGKKYYTVFDGILYINDHLTEGLGIERQRAESMDPVALITLAYHTRGVEMLQIADGSYAFAIFDEAKKELIVYRDKLGTKPLYYWYDPYGNFFFASEIKAFTGCSLWKAELNKQRAIDYLVWGRTHHTKETLFRNVFSIEPGYIFLLKSENNNFKLTINSSFWNNLIFELNSQKEFSDDPDAASFLKNNFYKIIKEILSIKGKKGIALSGGLDSTSILKVAEKIKSENSELYISDSFSACSTNIKYSEKVWIDKSLINSNINAHFIFAEGIDVIQKTEELVYQLDEPYHSQRPLLSSLFYKEAANHKIHLVLNGSAADALFNNSILIKFNILYQDLISLRIIPLVKKLSKSNHKKLYIKLLLKKTLDFKFLIYVHHLKIKNKWGSIINFSKLGLIDLKTNQIPDISSPSTFLNYFLRRPVQVFMNNADKSAQMNGVEVYFPFVNLELVKYNAQKIHNFDDKNVENKKTIRLAFGDIIPKEILNRREKGHFTTAEESWFLETNRGEFIEFFKKYVPFSKGIINEKAAIDYLTGMQLGKIPFNTSYWRLICFCVWMKVFDVQISEKP